MLSDDELANYKLMLEQKLVEVESMLESSGSENFILDKKCLKVVLYRIQDGTFGLCC
jgi:hypothetical protein